VEYTALVIIVALVEYVIFMAACGKARIKYKIQAPAVSGNEMFERYFRVQQNTLEQLVIFIPSILLCSYYFHAVAAAIVGIFFVIGRAIYFKHYIADPSARGPGMMITFIANVLLLAGALAGSVLSLL